MRRDLIPTNQNIIKNSSKGGELTLHRDRIEIDINKHNIIVGCKYRPPSYQLYYFNEPPGKILCKRKSEKEMYTLQETSIVIHS